MLVDIIINDYDEVSSRIKVYLLIIIYSYRKYNIISIVIFKAVISFKLIYFKIWTYIFELNIPFIVCSCIKRISCSIYELKASIIIEDDF